MEWKENIKIKRDGMEGEFKDKKGWNGRRI